MMMLKKKKPVRRLTFNVVRLLLIAMLVVVWMLSMLLMRSLGHSDTDDAADGAVNEACG